MPYRGAIYVGSRKVWEGPNRGEDRKAAMSDASKASGQYRGKHEATGAKRKVRVGVIKKG